MKLINKSTHTLKNLDIDKDKDKILKATEGVRKCGRGASRPLWESTITNMSQKNKMYTLSINKIMAATFLQKTMLEYSL